MNFLIDENLPPFYKRELLRRLPELTVWQIGEEGAPAFGTLDPVILEWCEANRFVLVTNNRNSMPQHLTDHLAVGKQCPGILVFRPQATAAQLLLDLELIAVAANEAEFYNRIFYLPL